MGSDNPKNWGNKLGNKLGRPIANNNPKKRKWVNSFRPNGESREFKIYITSFLAPITTILDCSLCAFLTSADSCVILLDSYIKQQMMNNFSLVAFTQIRHFGSLIPNIFSIHKFVFLLINAYM